MNSDNLLLLLKEGNHTLVVKNGNTETFNGRGVANLYILLKNRPDFLQGAEIADKAVGKAAAALMILGGVKQLSAALISRNALDLLEKYPLPVNFEKEVPYILNRSQTDRCPLESLCQTCATPQECLSAIKTFLHR
ncbi:MAG: DUF1893 domain-containing protein [Bacteroidales bacterium]|nr:DUF1893 domain-containing protein [Bacteroidales bacterium]